MAMVGIDLGTTNSLVAVWKDGASRLVENALGVTLTPSVVGLDDDGRVLVGQAAKERLMTHPERTAARFKRTMGSDKQIPLGDRCFRAEELSSFVLTSLKEDAEHFLGERVTEAVISVPAYFNDAQRKATRAAGKLAGLEVERLINEPTAAAIAYGMHEAPGESTFLVLDLGGGTFDVSVLELFEGVMEVRATAGDNFLGGEDFTDALVKAVLDQEAIATEKVALRPDERTRLRKAVEQAKLRLSDAESTTVQVPWAGREHEWTLSRGTFEGVTGPLVARLKAPLERALRDAKLEVADLDGLVLVGGATRMPLVRDRGARLIRINPDPDPMDAALPDEAIVLRAPALAALRWLDQSLGLESPRVAAMTSRSPRG